MIHQFYMPTGYWQSLFLWCNYCHLLMYLFHSHRNLRCQCWLSMLRDMCSSHHLKVTFSSVRSLLMKYMPLFLSQRHLTLRLDCKLSVLLWLSYLHQSLPLWHLQILPRFHRQLSLRSLNQLTVFFIIFVSAFIDIE